MLLRTYEVNSCVGSYCNTEEGYLHWHLMCMNTLGQFSHLCVICVVCSEFVFFCFEFCVFCFEFCVFCFEFCVLCYEFCVFEFCVLCFEFMF